MKFIKTISSLTIKVIFLVSTLTRSKTSLENTSPQTMSSKNEVAKETTEKITGDTKDTENKKVETSSEERDIFLPIDSLSEYIEEKAKFLASDPSDVAKSQIRRVSNEMALTLGRPRPIVFIGNSSYDARSIIGVDLEENKLTVNYIKSGSDNIFTDTYKIKSNYIGEIKLFFQTLMRNPLDVSELDWLEEWVPDTPDTSDD